MQVTIPATTLGRLQFMDKLTGDLAYRMRPAMWAHSSPSTVGVHRAVITVLNDLGNLTAATSATVATSELTTLGDDLARLTFACKAGFA